MDFFYDGQVRRYITQFMRFFIGFKYQSGDGEQKTVPVMYGDMTRQVAAIIRENSENKMISVPKIACYVTGLELDTSRLADATFVSKVNIRERAYEEFYPADYPDVALRNTPVYQNVQGGNYTVERLMPTPYKLTMKADIWTSSTDQKLQLLEQILVFFNPSFEIQTTDNFIDWTSLSVVNLKNLNFSSRTIPQGAESEIDICSLEFDMPVYITPPTKVKKLGVVKHIISNMFTEQGDIVNLEDLSKGTEQANISLHQTIDNYGVLLLKSDNGQDDDYDVSILNTWEAVRALRMEPPVKLGQRLDWNTVFDLHGGYTPGLSMIHFKQSNGTEISGTFTVNPVDPTYIVVTIDRDTVPANTLISAVDNYGRRLSGASAGTIDAIIDPQRYNPIRTFGGQANIPLGYRLLLLDDIGADRNVDGADAWAEYNPVGNVTDPNKVSDLVARANSFIEWNGTKWNVVYDPAEETRIVYITNLRTGIQYKWEDGQWLKSFEGEYRAGYWRFDLDV